MKNEMKYLRDLCAKQQETIDRLTALFAENARTKPEAQFHAMKVADVVQHYLAVKRDNLSPTTYAAYSNILTRSPFAKTIAHRNCDEITHAFLQRLIDQSPKTSYVKDFVVILRSVVKFARERELCATPPEDHTAFSYGKLVRRRANKEIDAETAERLKGKCLEHAETRPAALAVLLGLMCGLRIGEVGGLMWKDFDNAECTLSIQRASKHTWTKEEGYKTLIGDPKTKSSRRTIPLPQPLVPIFASHVGESGFCFHVKADVNKPLGIRSLRDKIERFLENRMGEAHFTFHSLRHTFVSQRIREGKNIKAVSAYVGHADIKMTLGTYTHLNQSDLRKAIA